MSSATYNPSLKRDDEYDRILRQVLTILCVWIGSTFAYWLDYGVSLHIPTSTKQWRVPVGVQMIPGALMLVGLFFLRESPRWLLRKGRHQKAIEALAHVRCEATDSPEIIQEMAEIRASVEEELNATEGVTWKEVLQPGMR